MSKYKILLFDMDGTIMDTDEIIIRAFYYFYDKYNHGKRRSDEEILTFSGPPIVDTFRVEFPEYDAMALRKEFIEMSKDLYDKYLRIYPYEKEVLETLKKRGYILAVVTNKSHEMAEYCLKTTGLSHLFDIIVGDGDMPKSKPAPDGINYILNKCGVNKSEALYIGDNDIDYETAVNAGVDSMIVSWGPRALSSLDKATYVIRSFKEIEKLL